MRYGRLQKFGKKNKLLWVFVKIAAAWYLLIGMSTAITGQTNAFFSDANEVNGTIAAGIWLSSLSIEQETLSGNDISAQITNSGAEMKSTGTYEVYYIETGDPQNGEKLFEGAFDKLNENQKTDVKYTPEKNGVYKFKAYDENDVNHAVWSSVIAVTTLEQIDPEALDKQEEEIETPIVEDPKEEVEIDKDIIEIPPDKKAEQPPNQDNEDKTIEEPIQEVPVIDPPSTPVEPPSDEQKNSN
ncbi:amyloid fiber anchoring/assembly protein TapA [Cytobacillus sp. FJAT-53684]|uniref:Amyloid fiber anchoring/assembly protein TapA n=1 Tax=Cytobacillus mangrovibacter TaxID=3299024 RepID=A0ABW6K0P5_9BACI